MGDGTFRKSTYSHADCVEVRELTDGSVEVRESGNPGGPRLRYSAGEWRAFIRGVHEGQFDFSSASGSLDH